MAPGAELGWVSQPLWASYFTFQRLCASTCPSGRDNHHTGTFRRMRYKMLTRGQVDLQASANVNSGITIRTLLISHLWGRPPQQGGAQGKGLSPASGGHARRQEPCSLPGVHSSRWQVTHTSTCSSSLTRPPPRQPPRILSHAERARVCALAHTHTHTPPVPAHVHPGNVDLARGPTGLSQVHLPYRKARLAGAVLMGVPSDR